MTGRRSDLVISNDRRLAVAACPDSLFSYFCLRSLDRALLIELYV